MNNRLITIIVALLSLVGIILFVRVLGIEEEQVAEMSGAVSPLVTFSIALLIIAFVVTVLASLWSLLKNPAALKKSLLGLVVLGVLLLVSYIFSNDGEVIDANNKVIAAAGSSISKNTSAGIWYSIILIVVAGGFFVYDLLKGLVKS